MRSPLLTLVLGFFLQAPPADALEVLALQARVVDHAYQVVLEARLDAPAARVARVLNDFADYGSLDPRIRRSQVIGGTPAGEVLISTRVLACAAFFCRNVDRVERVRREEGRLVAEVLPERSDLRRGLTRTDWSEEDGRTRLRYVAEFEPDFWVPAIVARAYASTTLRESVLQLFRNVEDRARVP